jgi:hypothetical protein
MGRKIRVHFPTKAEIFLFSAISILALGLTQPPIQWMLAALSAGVKQPRDEIDHSPPSSAKVTNAWIDTSVPPYVFIVWYLIKHRSKFTFIIFQYV